MTRTEWPCVEENVMPIFPIRSALPPLSPTGLERPWRDWTMMPVAAVTLAQMWAVQVYAQLVLGRWQGGVGQNPPRRVRPHGSARSGSRAPGQ
jgi:hypothetical protein